MATSPIRSPTGSRRASPQPLASKGHDDGGIGNRSRCQIAEVVDGGWGRKRARAATALGCRSIRLPPMKRSAPWTDRRGSRFASERLLPIFESRENLVLGEREVAPEHTVGSNQPIRPPRIQNLNRWKIPNAYWLPSQCRRPHEFEEKCRSGLRRDWNLITASDRRHPGISPDGLGRTSRGNRLLLP